MDEWHKELNLKMWADRRKLFMLSMMYKMSLEENNVERCGPEMLLRTGPKVKMKIAFTNKERVLRSPYYTCNRLWEKLDSTIQTSKTVVDF